MLAVLPPNASNRPRLGEVSDPVPAAGEVLLAVKATALNRADLLQMRGLYPPPPGESEVPGLECAGVVAGLGPEVTGWSVGDRAMALVAGGGHAELAAVPVGQLMPVPDSFSWEQAAAVPEVALTAWTNLSFEGRLRHGETVVITAAASGVGTFAVQLARELGGRVLVAGRNLGRLEPLLEMGATATLSLGAGFPERVRELTAGNGADLVIELAGGEQLPRSLEALAHRGRLVLVGILAGPQAGIDLTRVLRQRLRIIGSVLRARSRPEKAALVEEFQAFGGERLADGRLRPVIDRVLAFREIADAYAALAAGGVLGKIILRL